MALFPSLASRERHRRGGAARLAALVVVALVAAGVAATPSGAAGQPSSLAFTVQPAPGAKVAPNAVKVTVAVEDVHGNVVSTDNSTAVTLALGTAPLGAVLTCAGGLSATVTAGEAAFACAVDVLGAYTLVATSAPVFTEATSNSFDVTQYLAFSTSPSGGTSAVALATQPVVALRNLAGATIVGDSSTIVTLAIASGPVGATLSCTAGNTRQAVTGVATFAGCKIDKAGNYTLSATALAFAPVTSTALTIVPGPADHLEFTTQPANGALVAPTLTLAVAVTDAAGNIETSDSATAITLAVGTGPGSLSCDPPGVTVTVTAGIATFPCTLSVAGTYTLAATSAPVVTPVTSNSFTVAQYASFSTQPGGSTGGVALVPQPTITLRDADGSVQTTNNATVVTLGIATGPNGAALTCANGLSRTVSAGVAGFNGCKIDKAGVYTLQVTAAAYAPAGSVPVVVAVGTPARLVFTIQPGDGSAGFALVGQPQVTIEDLGGNRVASDTSPIALSVATGTGTADAHVSCAPTATVAGVADFDDCVVDRAGTAYQLVATDVADALTGASSAFDVAFVDPSRIFGTDAIATSLWISSSEFPVDGSAGAVVLARSDFYSDALTGGPLAAAMDAPLLITPGTPQQASIDPRVLDEIERVLDPGRTVYLLGGPLALPPSIDGTLEGLGYTTVRLAGENLFGTAVAIAGQLGNPSIVFEATGLDFADALSAVPAAIQAHGAILLTNGTSQSPETAAYLALYAPVIRFAIGGPLAAASADPGATAVYGQDLYDTSAAVAATFFSDAGTFGAATGTTFPDALSGGVFMATGGRLGPVLLVEPTAPLPTAIEQFLADDQQGVHGFVFGGPLAVADDVVAAIAAVIGGP